ncbi:MAG: hypothetical protein WBX38_22935 [Candidatus Sulfotelmatobacter sp.]
MSVNREQPHVLVLPEDDENARLANEFHKQLDMNRLRRMQVLQVAGGWNEVLKAFESNHVAEMNRWPKRFMVLLIDFDNREDRLERARRAIPNHLANRVFVLGVLTEPEDLKTEFGSYDKVGSELATDCRGGTDTTWGHKLLRHNAAELDSLRKYVRPFLFR